MLSRMKVSASFGVLALMFMTCGVKDANAGSQLPDPIKAGLAERLYRLDCGHSLANDESVWTPGENVGRYRILVYLLADKARKRVAALGYRCSGSYA
jgi:N-acyl homoserine lactone hydrolase